MKKIILDTDIGDNIDDALALAFAVLSVEIDLLGVTTVFKNTEKRAELACCVLESAGRTDIPVYAGVGQTILQSIPDWENVVVEHHTQQMEILTVQQASTRPQTGRAVDFIIDAVMSGDNDITIGPIGPLTNIATAFLTEPRLAQKAKIWFMGGVIDWVSPEWNVICHPDAAGIVFGSGAQIAKVGLDATTKCHMPYD